MATIGPSAEVNCTGFEPSEVTAAPTKIIRPDFRKRIPAAKPASVPSHDADIVALAVTDPRELEIPTFIRRQMD